MTDKTEAQPEALRLAAEFEDCARIDAIPSINDVKKSAAELRRQHAEIQQLKAEKSEMAALNYENYEFQRKKADAATATVYRFHYAMKDAGWHPGRTDDDLTDIIRAKGRELAQLSARQAAPDGWRLVPVEPTVAQINAAHARGFFRALSIPLYDAMLSAAPPAPEREPKCWCETCRPNTLSDMRFIVCPDCGNKRCPKATHHDNACTNSNAPGQPGSSWEHVKPHGATND